MTSEHERETLLRVGYIIGQNNVVTPGHSDAYLQGPTIVFLYRLRGMEATKAMPLANLLAFKGDLGILVLTEFGLLHRKVMEATE